METQNPHEKLRQIEADIKEIEKEKAELDAKYERWPLSEFKKQIDRLEAQLEKQLANKKQVLNEIQLSLF